MNRSTRIFYLVTGLMGTLMGLFSVPDVLLDAQAVTLIKHLGYPVYLLPFVGVMKLLGVAAVLLPRVPPRLKEWAYAGLFFDVLGALYSAIAVGDAPATWLPPIVALLLITSSYVVYRRRPVGPLVDRDLRSVL